MMTIHCPYTERATLDETTYTIGDPHSQHTSPIFSSHASSTPCSAIHRKIRPSSAVRKLTKSEDNFVVSLFPRYFTSWWKVIFYSFPMSTARRTWVRWTGDPPKCQKFTSDTMFRKVKVIKLRSILELWSYVFIRSWSSWRLLESKEGSMYDNTQVQCQAL